MQGVFAWDLMSVADSLPTHFVNYMLANGIVFDNEESLCGGRYSLVEVAARLADRTLILLDTLVWEKGASKVLWAQQASRLSAAVVLAARIEECRSLLSKGGSPTVNVWPAELQKMTRCSEEEIEDLAYFLIKLNNEQPHLAAPKEEEVEEGEESIFGGKAQPVMTSEEFDNHIIRLIQEGKLPMPNSDEEFEELLQMKEVTGLLHEGLLEPVKKPEGP